MVPVGSGWFQQVRVGSGRFRQVPGRFRVVPGGFLVLHTPGKTLQ